MKKLLMIALCACLSACTLTQVMSPVDGTASDLVDVTPDIKSDPTVNATVPAI